MGPLALLEHGNIEYWMNHKKFIWQPQDIGNTPISLQNFIKYRYLGLIFPFFPNLIIPFMGKIFK